MRTRRVAAACVLVSALLHGGCSIVHRTTGRPLPDSTALLQPGRTTKAQALAALGPPISIRRQFDGDLLFWRRDVLHSERLLLIPLVPLYENTEGSAGSDVLALLFDRDGVLAGVGEQRDIR